MCRDMIFPWLEKSLLCCVLKRECRAANFPGLYFFLVLYYWLRNFCNLIGCDEFEVI